MLTNEHALAMATSLPNLECLNLFRASKKILPVTIETLATKCKALKRLDMGANDKLTDDESKCVGCCCCCYLSYFVFVVITVSVVASSLFENLLFFLLIFLVSVIAQNCVDLELLFLSQCKLLTDRSLQRYIGLLS